MSFYDDDYRPIDLGLEYLGSVSWSNESYQFNLTGVWRHKGTGDIYYADDSGCSCPAAWEGIRSLDDLARAERMQDLVDHLQHRLDNVDRTDEEYGWGMDAEEFATTQREVSLLVRKAFL